MKKERIYYLDNLKIFLTCLVIAHHSAHAYGNIFGKWIYSNSSLNNWLYCFIVINASFFMGLFFMIAGYFTPKSLNKRTLKEFVFNKARRLILPVVLIMLLIVPAYFYIAFISESKYDIGFFDYYINVYIGQGKFSYEHGWFIVHLFIYSVFYGIASKILSKRKIKNSINLKLHQLFILAIIIGCLYLIARYNYPTDRWIALFGVIGMEPAHIAQYILFFMVGILAFHNNWFDQISNKEGCFFITSSAIMVFITYLSKYLPKGAWGFIWKNWGFYESFMGIFLSFALIFVFKKYLNKSNKFLGILSRASFLVYIIHTFFVVVYQVALDNIRLCPTIKFFIVTILSITSSYLCSIIIKFIIKKIGRRFSLEDAKI